MTKGDGGRGVSQKVTNSSKRVTNKIKESGCWGVDQKKIMDHFDDFTGGEKN